VGDDAGSSSSQLSGTDRLAERSAALRATLTRYFARHGVLAADCEDAVQEVFVRIVRRGHCDDLADLDGYIFTTAGSVLRDRHRRRGVRRADEHIPFDAESHAGVAASAEHAMLAREALHEVSLALADLSETARNIFVLRRIEGMPYAEIALRLGMSIGAVEKQMMRATRHVFARTGGLA
jgi:RNA polymerase sigma factor (sigma-70 family)